MASGLQVTPISLSLQANETASGLTLSNTASTTVHAQVRVFHWSQDEQGDQLTPSRGLLASPPMIELGPGEHQIVRIIRSAAPPKGDDAVEDSYRLSIDELPIESDEKSQGLNFVLSYSLPVFVQPVGDAETRPALQWTYSAEPANEKMKLQVSNSGNGHAQLSDLRFVDDQGKSVVLHKGLLGYVLPGASMEWPLIIPPSLRTAGGKIKVRINGKQATQDISQANPAD